MPSPRILRFPFVVSATVVAVVASGCIWSPSEPYVCAPGVGHQDAVCTFARAQPQKPLTITVYEGFSSDQFSKGVCEVAVVGTTITVKVVGEACTGDKFATKSINTLGARQDELQIRTSIGYNPPIETPCVLPALAVGTYTLIVDSARAKAIQTTLTVTADGDETMCKGSTAANAPRVVLDRFNGSCTKDEDCMLAQSNPCSACGADGVITVADKEDYEVARAKLVKSCWMYAGTSACTGAPPGVPICGADKKCGLGRLPQ
jgi:hypothetical protein